MDRTVRSDRKNLESLVFAVLLALRTPLWEKNKDPCEPQSNLTVPFKSKPLKKKKKHKKTHTKKQALNSAPFRVGDDGGEGRLLERTVFVEEIEGTRDSVGGGRAAAVEACI